MSMRQLKFNKPGRMLPPNPAYCFFSSRLRAASSLRYFVAMRSISLTRHSIPSGSVLRSHAPQIDSKRRFSGSPPIVSRSRPNVSRSENMDHASALRFVISVGRGHVAHGGASPFNSFSSRQSSHEGLDGLPYHSTHRVSFFVLPEYRCGPRHGCAAASRWQIQGRTRTIP